VTRRHHYHRRRLGLLAAVACAAGLSLGAPLGSDARADVLFDLGRTEGYGGPFFRLSTLRGEPVVTGGGPLAMVMVNRRFAAGLVWQSAEGDYEGRWPTYLTARGEFFLANAGPLHVSVGQGIGVGGMIRSSPGATLGGATFAVVEPDATLALAITGSTRVALTGGYRFAPWTSDRGAWSERDLSGPFVGVALQDGNFGARASPRAAPPTVQLSGFVSEKLTWVAGEPTILDGGGTRLLLGRYLAVGVTGYASRSEVSRAGRSFGVGYGALEGAVTLNPVGPVRAMVGLAAGIGGAGWVDVTPAGKTASASVMLVIEPELLLETDVLDFVRFAVGPTYRGAICLSCAPPITGGALSGPALAAQLRFGWF